jgi:membrane protease YdiL (CAAX protease family)
VFLLGIVCLFISGQMIWGPILTIHAPILPTPTILVTIAAYAVRFAGAAGCFFCFWPGRSPLRRLIWWVCLPASLALVVVCATYTYLAALAIGNLSLRNLGTSVSILTKLGPGFHYALIGFALVAVFTSRVALGFASLPLALPQGSVSQADDGLSWNRLHIVLWLLFMGSPLFLCSFLVLLALGRAHVLGRILNAPWLLEMLLHDIGFIALIGLAVWILGKEAWKAVRRSVQLPLPESFLLAMVVPIGINLLILLGVYLVERARWALHISGRPTLPQLSSYFGSLTVGIFLSNLLPAFWEEVIIRGLLQPRFIRRYGLFRGVFLVGIVFAAMHFWADFTVPMTDGAVLISLGIRLLQCIAMSGVLGWLTLRTASVLPAALAHCINNLIPDINKLYIQPKIPGVTILVYLLWGALAYVLFRYWPVQAEAVQESGAAFAGNMTQSLGHPSEQPTLTNHPRGLHSRMLGILRRPFLGPVLFGLLYGGIPCGIIFGFLGGDVYTVALLRFAIGLTPLAIVVSTLSPTLGVNRKWQHILWRVSLTSFATCVPVPAIVCTELARRWGPWVVNDIPGMITFLSLWTIAVIIPSWLLAFGYALLKNRRSRRVTQP